MKNKKHLWITAMLVISQILLAFTHVNGQVSEIPNNSFGYSIGSDMAFYSPKTDKQTLNWKLSLNRFLGSKNERGGTFYFGLEYDTKLRFKFSDSTGTRIVTTPTGDFAFGFAIQNSLSTQYSGSTVKFTAGVPITNDKEMKFHFGTVLRLNVNLFILDNLFSEPNIFGLYLEVGADGLVYDLPDSPAKTLLSPKFGLGINILVPEKK